MGGDTPCNLSSLWNWNTIDSCFISEQWHIRSTGAYAGSVVAVFFLVILLELFRRAGRIYDRRIFQDHLRRHGSGAGGSTDKLDSPRFTPRFRPTLMQQAIRSVFYCVQFSAAYLLMLIGMYFNGGLILAIFAGSYFGFFASSWDTVGSHDAHDSKGLAWC